MVTCTIQEPDKMDSMATISLPVRYLKALAALLGPFNSAQLTRKVKAESGQGGEYLAWLDTHGYDWSFDMYRAFQTTLEANGLDSYTFAQKEAA